MEAQDQRVKGIQPRLMKLFIGYLLKFNLQYTSNWFSSISMVQMYNKQVAREYALHHLYILSTYKFPSFTSSIQYVGLNGTRNTVFLDGGHTQPSFLYFTSNEIKKILL